MTNLTEFLMFFNGDNIVFILISFLPLLNQNIVFWNYIINPKSFIFSKRIFDSLVTFENYYSSIAYFVVRHKF